jgi:ABC-type dipeptide/oligopeptide/nickel transport system permease component
MRHALQRIGLAIPVLFGVLLIGFLLMQVVPTDPATVRAGPQATAEIVAAIRTELGLDEPIWVQFGIYLGRLAHGDLGVSIINNVPVTKKTYKGAAPEAVVSNFRVKIDGCVGESFIRSYATLANSTAEAEDIVSWFGVTKVV